jgi:alpha-tubulin suppressor-like RCC1 family protein
VAVKGISGATSIATDFDQTCAIVGGGGIECWGDNVSKPEVVAGISGATAVALGRDTCAILDGGRIECWGDNQFGQLGKGTTAPNGAPVPASGPVSGISGATEVGVGNYSLCALLGGTIKCWGWNVAGQLGDGTTTDRSTPVAVSGIDGATALAVGDMHACAVLGGDTIKCWGDNTYGQLGDGTRASHSTPVTVS